MRQLLPLHLCFAVLQLFPSVLSMSFDPDIVKIIDSAVENYFLPYNNLTGFGLSVVKIQNGTTNVLSKGYGFRNLEDQILADNQTIFSIGSITKSFTATIVVKTLTEKFPQINESVLDVPIRTLLPSANFTLGDRFRSESTTFRDLLSHRMCINPGTLAFLLRSYKNAEEYAYRLRYSEEICSFRTTFTYNNAAYIMAGEIIAQIANSTFENMLTNLLREIGMNNTIIVRDSDDYENIPNMSRGYYTERDGETKQYSFELLKWVSISAAPGGILSTSEDMLKYMLFHINNGKVGDKQVVPETVMGYLRKGSIVVNGLTGKKEPDDVTQSFTAYGLGFLVGLLDGWESISHDGLLPPYKSYMSFYPGLKLGIFTVGNGPNTKPDVYFLHKLIYEIIEKDQRNIDSLKTRPKYKSLVKPNIEVCDVQSVVNTEDIVGNYGNPLEAEFTISQANGSLQISYGQWGKGTLRPYSNTSFSIDWSTDIDQLFSIVDWKEQLIDFSQANKASFIVTHYQTEGLTPFVFEKNLTLDTLPSQPWASDSCGPTKIITK